MFALFVVSFLFSFVSADPTFYSRPEIQPPTLTVTKSEDGVSEGYIFMAPYDIDQSGPYIFDMDGNLVWCGYGQAMTADAHDFQLVTVNNETRLAFYAGTEVNGYGRGHGVILDTSYTHVTSVATGNGRASVDLHEFHLVSDDSGETTALVSIYQPVPYDLSSYGISGGLGWVISGVFQEINAETGEVLFEWSSIDHVPLEASYKDIGDTGGTTDAAYDYFHINAVDKDSSGNYWISSRHTSCLYYLSGTTGEILYRVNGYNSSFALSSSASFSSQHHVRLVNETDTTVVLTLFDNASDGTNTTESYSRGMMISLDLDEMTASLLAEYISPSELLCSSQGSVQLLDSGNVFVGWGKKTYVSEFTQDGACVFDANWESDGGMNYRAFKYNFTSEPLDVPAVWAYTDGSDTTVYMSWNGATKVKYWNVYGGSSTSSLTLLSTLSKSGFETNTTFSSTYAYIIAEALDSSKNALSNSTAATTFAATSILASSNSKSKTLLSADTSSTSTSVASKVNTVISELHSQATVGAWAVMWAGLWGMAWTMWCM